MKPLSLIMEDAATMRGIIALLEEAPATTHEVAMTQHVGSTTAGRCCAVMQQAGIIEHQAIPKDILGVTQLVPQLEWCLTAAYQRGEILLDAETLARGI